jgi:hypothetical protein
LSIVCNKVQQYPAFKHNSVENSRLWRLEAVVKTLTALTDILDLHYDNIREGIRTKKGTAEKREELFSQSAGTLLKIMMLSADNAQALQAADLAEMMELSLDRAYIIKNKRNHQKGT